MTSKRETVLDALAALIAAVVPGAEVKRNLAKPERIPTGGLVVIRDGEPGDPEVSLSPATYLYSHRVFVELAVSAAGSLSGEQALDALLFAIGSGLAANRTLSGLCDWIEAGAPISGDIETLGAVPGRYAELTVVVTYATADPLN